MTIFGLKNEGEKWSTFFYFKVERAPSEIPANLSSQFSNYFALGSSNSEGARSISKLKILDHFSSSY